MKKFRVWSEEAGDTIDDAVTELAMMPVTAAELVAMKTWEPSDGECLDFVVECEGVVWDVTVDVEFEPHFDGTAIKRTP